jgi:beta-glucosidase
MDVLFPFGHGLSYTTFEYSNIRLSAESIDDTGTLTVEADITNTGQVAGKEIVQLYVAPKSKDDWVIRPEKELREFAKVALEPGETKTVSFSLGKRAFACYNTKLRDWHVPTGVYNILLCRSSRDIALSMEVTVNATKSIPFRADVNTTVRDILRMHGGEALIKELTANAPVYANMDGPPEPGTIEYMHYSMLPDMVMRMMRMMSKRPDMTIDDLQAMLDEKVNIL